MDPNASCRPYCCLTYPAGLRGLLLVVLAAAMSTFNATVNLTTGFITRDIYQKYIHRRASTRELIYVSWAGVCSIVVISVCLRFFHQEH